MLFYDGLDYQLIAKNVSADLADGRERIKNSDFGGRRPTEGGGRSPAGESFPPCPWGRPRSGGGERGEASATKQKKPALRLACLVDQTPKFSNLLEDLWKVERFAQYIENQASENMAEMEGSEIKQ